MSDHQDEPRSPDQERRENKRIKKSFILSYYELDHPGKKYDITQLKNISLGGVCFVTTKNFAPSTKLGIELKTPYLAETTHLEGVVVESEEKMKNTIYETRLKLNPLDTEAKVLLEKLIDFFLNKNNSSNE